MTNKTQTFNISDQLDKIKSMLVSTDSKAGEMIVYKNDSIVCRAIIMYGEYSDAEVQVMSRYLKPDSLYLDIGTNVGYHALAVNKQVGCPVIGFEPHPSHFTVAALNAKDKNIQIFKTAVGDKNGTIPIMDFDINEIQNYGEVAVAKEESDTTVNVPIVRLDDLETELGLELPKCTVIKIDTEGCEFDVLNGAAKTIDTFRPVIFYEAIDYDVWIKCERHLNKLNYSQYWVTVLAKPLNGNYKNNDSDPFNKIGVTNILAVPNELEQPTDLVPVQPNEAYRELIERMQKYKILF